MIQQRLIHGRHAGQRRRLGALQRRQHLRPVEARQHHHFASVQHRAVEDACVGEDMEEGQHRQYAIRRFGMRIDQPHLAGIGGQILMGQHRALGPAGRAAGILQQRDVIFRVDGDLGGILAMAQQIDIVGDARIVRDGNGFLPLEDAEKDRLGWRQHLRHASDDQPFEAAVFQHLQRGGQQRLGRQGEENFRATVLDLMFQFGGGIKGGEIDDDRARHHRPIIGRDIMGHIGQVKADAVALLHAQILQAPGDAPYDMQHFAIAGLATHEVDHDRIGVGRGAIDHHVHHRKRRKILLPGSGVVIAALPDIFSALHCHRCK
jgi:hypothetical protein